MIDIAVALLTMGLFQFVKGFRQGVQRERANRVAIEQLHRQTESQR